MFNAHDTRDDEEEEEEKNTAETKRESQHALHGPLIAAIAMIHCTRHSLQTLGDRLMTTEEAMLVPSDPI